MFKSVFINWQTNKQTKKPSRGLESGVISCFSSETVSLKGVKAEM